MSRQWWDTLELLIPHSNRMGLLGPPGTGKSTTAAIVLKQLCGGVQRITMTEGAGIEDLLGMFVLTRGETKWMDGPAARALRNGEALLIDEIDKFSPEVGSLLYALLDDDPQVMLPTGEHLIAKAGYKVIGTSNANISSLPEAIIDRLEAILLAIKPHPAALEELSDAMKGSVELHYSKMDAKPWRWSGMPTARRMRAFNKLIKARKQDRDEALIADAVFGVAGKEHLSVLATSAAGARL